MKYLSFLILFTLTIGCETSIGGESKKVTKENAQSIAVQELKKMGYDSTKMSQEISLHDAPFNKYLPRNSESEFIKERQNKLQGHKYWAIYFYPKSNTSKGGDVCIFIDAKNGAVLTNYRGK